MRKSFHISHGSYYTLMCIHNVSKLCLSKFQWKCSKRMFVIWKSNNMCETLIFEFEAYLTRIRFEFRLMLIAFVDKRKKAFITHANICWLDNLTKSRGKISWTCQMAIKTNHSAHSSLAERWLIAWFWMRNSKMSNRNEKIMKLVEISIISLIICFQTYNSLVLN